MSSDNSNIDRASPSSYAFAAPPSSNAPIASSSSSMSLSNIPLSLSSSDAAASNKRPRLDDDQEQKHDLEPEPAFVDPKVEDKIINSKEITSAIAKFIRNTSAASSALQTATKKLNDLKIRKANSEVPASISSKINLYLPTTENRDKFMNDFMVKKRQYENDLIDIMIRSHEEHVKELNIKITNLESVLVKEITTYLSELHNQLSANNRLFRTSVSFNAASMLRKVQLKAVERFQSHILSSSMKELEIKHKEADENKKMIIEKEILENKSSEEKIGSLVKQQVSSEMKKISKKIDDKFKDLSTQKNARKKDKPDTSNNSSLSFQSSSPSKKSNSKKDAQKNKSKNNSGSRKSDSKKSPGSRKSGSKKNSGSRKSESSSRSSSSKNSNQHSVSYNEKKKEKNKHDNGSRKKSPASKNL